MVFPLGEPPSNDGRKWRFTAEDLAAVWSESKTWTEKKPILYAHGKDVARGSEAAGWIDHLELGHDGLYAIARLTDEAKRAVEDGKWGYRSPGFDAREDKDGAIRPIRLHELSLVPDPAIGGMPAITAAAEPQLELFDTSTTSPLVEASIRKEPSMDKLRALLGLADGASEDEFIQAVEKLKAPPETPPDAAAASTAQAQVLEMIRAEAARMDEARQLAAKVEAAVDGAIRSGKVTVGQRDEALVFARADFGAFEKFVAAAPRVAPVAPVISGTLSPELASTNYADTVRASRLAALAAAQR